MEQWKDVIGYEGLYQVSNLGKIKNYRRESCSGKIFKRKFLPAKDGRERVCLRKNGKNTFTFVSRLVAKVFIPNPENKPIVDHINHDVTNNTVSNLRWATFLENQKNRKQTRVLPKGIFLRPSGRYQAYTKVNSKFVHLGIFTTIEDASKKVIEFNKKLYGEFYLASTGGTNVQKNM